MIKLLSFLCLISSFTHSAEVSGEITPLYKRQGDWLLYSCERIKDHVIEIELIINYYDISYEAKKDIIRNLNSIKKHMGITRDYTLKNSVITTMPVAPAPPANGVAVLKFPAPLPPPP